MSKLKTRKQLTTELLAMQGDGDLYPGIWTEQPCKSCDHVRRVRASLFAVTGAGASEQAHWTELCGACDLDYRAWLHERTAQEFRIRARAIHAKRKKKAKAKAEK
jgi:hypothetical protein